MYLISFDKSCSLYSKSIEITISLDGNVAGEMVKGLILGEEIRPESIEEALELFEEIESELDDMKAKYLEK